MQLRRLRVKTTTAGQIILTHAMYMRLLLGGLKTRVTVVKIARTTVHAINVRTTYDMRSNYTSNEMVENLMRQYLSFCHSLSVPLRPRKFSRYRNTTFIHRAGLRLIAKLVSDFRTGTLPSSRVCSNDPKAQFMTK